MNTGIGNYECIHTMMTVRDKLIEEMKDDMKSAEDYKMATYYVASMCDECIEIAEKQRKTLAGIIGMLQEERKENERARKEIISDTE